MNTAKTENSGKNDKSENADNSNDLNPIEKKTLASCEASIRNGLKAYQNVGKALTTIQHGKLYRAEYSTMVKYAREKWDMTTARVAQLTHAYRVHEFLSMHNIKPLPATESQCRPLARIPQDENMDSVILAVWNAVVESGEKITALLINAEVDKALGIEPKESKSADDTASENESASAKTAESASAEMRAEVRELRKKIAFLESALQAEKNAHQFTKKANGVPKSDLAKELYKRGFRAMAKTYHPDHGGTSEEMAELLKVKASLGI